MNELFVQDFMSFYAKFIIMAEILFGSPSVRLNVNKVWRNLRNPEQVHTTYKERKDYIYRVKKELNLDYYLRHSIRKMTNGSQYY